MQTRGKEKTIALVGNPNSGKTLLFNALTGSNLAVGNWPGVTVEKKEGNIKGEESITLQDLPGIYSLSPYTQEEVIARSYLVEERPDLILNIVDGTNMERNLYLTTQLTELNIPVVVAINMMDRVNKNGDHIDFDELSKGLKCPVVGVSALKEQGLDELIKTCKKHLDKNGQEAICSFSKPITEALASIQTELLKNKPENIRYWLSLKLFEGDREELPGCNFTSSQITRLEEIIKKAESECDDDAEAVIIDERYENILGILEHSYNSNQVEETLSDKVDKIVTNRWLAIPIFIGIMCLMYFISIAGLGLFMTDWVNDVLFGEWISNGATAMLNSLGASEWVHSLVVDGIIGGIGAPLGFVPQMAMVFLFLGILQDCGYMARVAFIMDRIFRKFGLSGKSFLSFLVSAGCGVPGILATRTIENPRDRDMTMITTTAIPCGAKLPIIALVGGYIIGGAWWVAPLIYFASIVIVILACLIMKKFKLFAGEPAPFVMELPEYHMPTARGLGRHVWTRVRAFLKKAGTIIFAMCILMWFLGSFGVADGRFQMVEAENSFLAIIGNAIAWIFAPLGFGNWQSVAATFSGFTAKEAVVSTMGVLAGLGSIENYDPSMHAAFQAFFPSNISAVSFLFFNLLNTPCLAAVSVLYREVSSKKVFAFALIFQNLGAYAVSLIIYQIIGLMIGEVAFSFATVVAFIVVGIFLYLLFRPQKTTERLDTGVHYQRA